MGEKRLYHAIADKITNLIKEGVFPAGARLPGERELAQRFGVSRVTIREAEIALQAIGSIEIKTGSGVYVCEDRPSISYELPEVSAFELTEARSLIESEAAALAALNISNDDLDKLDEFIVLMTSKDEDIATKADNDFHSTIAQATGNAALVHCIKMLWRMRSEIPQVNADYQSVCHSNTASKMREHQAICDALKARDPMAARKAMRAHFQRLIESMLDVSEKQALEKVQEQANASRQRFLATSSFG